jgi:anion-transporting  ArsA/GET3 family ATPase
MSAEAFARRALLEPRIAVCVGTGGVGKTTVAAALALEAARRGRRVLVLTIDPARRLADALGVAALGNQPERLPAAALASLGVPAQASLSALMLDMKRTFDDLVERFAESPETRARILDNVLYQHVSEALAGSIEYSAMEKVYELHEARAYDLIVVDTPPSQHALDFLEAPQRLLEFLESRIVQMLIHPAFVAGRLGFRLFQRGARRVLQILERVSGIGFLEDVSEFLLAFEGMSEGFRQRASGVRALLLGRETAFVLVAGAGRDSVAQALALRERLAGYGARLAGVLVNRVRLWPGGGAPPELSASQAARDALAAALAASEGARFPAQAAAQAALAAAAGYAACVRRDARETLALRDAVEKRGGHSGVIPELADDVHDLEGLARIARAIFGQGTGGARDDRERGDAGEPRRRAASD